MIDMLSFLPALIVSASGECGPLCLRVADDVNYESVTESERLYQDGTHETIEGVIADVNTVTLKDGAKFMQLILESGGRPIRVHLGPDWYMADKATRLELDVGRAVSVVGNSCRRGAASLRRGADRQSGSEPASPASPPKRGAGMGFGRVCADRWVECPGVTAMSRGIWIRRRVDRRTIQGAWAAFALPATVAVFRSRP
jgi:hypothetical protein